MGFSKDREPGNDNDEYVKAFDYDELKERVEQLKAALLEAVEYVTLDSEYPPDMVGKWRSLVASKTDVMGVIGYTSETKGNQAATAPSDAGDRAPTPRGSLPNTLGTICAKCGEELIDGHHKPDPIPPLF
jgi:hypothetical protein